MTCSFHSSTSVETAAFKFHQLGFRQLRLHNKYFVLFAAASGAPACEAPEGYEGLPFAEAVASKVSDLKHPEFIERFLHAVCAGFRQRDEQAGPWLYVGGEWFQPPRGMSQAGGAREVRYNRSAGYSINRSMPSSCHRQSGRASSEAIIMEDYRRDQRLRIDRMDAPQVNVCFIIIGNTQGMPADQKRTQICTNNVGPHYLICEDGTCYNFVDEERMAWLYNDAFWGGDSCIRKSGKVPCVGKLNELKSYSISILLEGDGTHTEFTDKQYDILLNLMKKVMDRTLADLLVLVQSVRSR